MTTTELQKFCESHGFDWTMVIELMYRTDIFEHNNHMFVVKSKIDQLMPFMKEPLLGEIGKFYVYHNSQLKNGSLA